MPINYSSRVFTILFVLWVAVSAIYPRVPGSLLWLFKPTQPISTEHALKPGIDMVGGTSLTYEIKQPDDGRPRPELANEVTTALKKRVDPQGVKNLIWRPEGASRLEIQMPLTKQSAESSAARVAYAVAKDKLEATNLQPAAVVDELSKLTGTVRDEKIKQYAMDSKTRSDVLQHIAAAADLITTARLKGDIAAAADGRIKLDNLQSVLSDTNLPVASFESAFDQDATDRNARISGLEKKNADFPARLKVIEEMVKLYDAGAKNSDLDSADALKRLLRGSGVLEFHILATDLDQNTYQQYVSKLQTNGPRPQSGDSLRWFQYARPNESSGFGQVYEGRVYALTYIDPPHSMINGESLPKWAVDSVSKGADPNGGNAVNFSLDALGSRLFGELSNRYRAQNGKIYRLALVLDDKLVSAPSLPEHAIFGNVQITGGNGGFASADEEYLVTTLSAGSLPAQLTDQPISEITVGPQLGADNLRAGLISCGLGLVVVFFFLVIYYYTSGFIAFVAVLANLVMILGVMALLNATFTLPGVAGIVLSVAIAVDANVLIFERLREEQARGLGLKLALANSYNRAFGAIFDGQVTTAISSAFLFIFGSEEVRGFGLTLLVGIATSLFTALYVTKTIFAILVDKGQIRDLSSLPRTFPKWNELLHPKLDWIKLAPAFLAFSVVVIGGGLFCFALAWHSGSAFDIEFSGGTSVRVAVVAPMAGQQSLDRAAVQKLVESESVKRPDELAAPRVVALGSDDREFEISTPTTDSQKVQEAVIEAIGPRLDIAKPSTFDGVSDDYAAADGKLAVPLETGQSNSAIPSYLAQSHAGGVALLLNHVDPPLDAKTLRSRVLARVEQENAERRPENVEVETFDNDTRAIVVVTDSRYAYDPTDTTKQQAWRTSLAAPAWQIVKDGVHNPPQLKGVTSFNAQVASEAQWNTSLALFFSFVGILAYIWLRFGNIKFGMATVVAAIHDALFVVAAIGFSHYLPLIPGVEKILLIHPFRVDLTLVAAVLTVVGYSLNDTVVIFDRVRENRGRFGMLSRRIINDSVNQTFSRTLLTGGTSIGILLIMYLFGGEGIHGFTFVMLLGIIVGTYSSIAVACPLLLLSGQRTISKIDATPAPVGVAG